MLLMPSLMGALLGYKKENALAMCRREWEHGVEIRDRH